MRIASLILLWAGGAWAQPAADAVAAFRAEPTTATRALTQAMADSPGAKSALQQLRGEAHLAAGARDAAFRDGRAVLASGAPWRSRAAWLVVRAAHRPAQCEAAMAARPAVRVDHRRVTTAGLHAETSRLVRLCRGAQAQARWVAEQAVKAPQLGPAPADLTPDARFTRAAAFERLRDYRSARTELEALVSGPHGSKARFELARLSLDRTRDDFEGAARAFAALAAEAGPYQVESAYQHARALGRAGKLAPAVAAYQALAERWPTHARALDARFFAAFLQYESGAYRDAAAGFARIERGAWTDAARWYHAWCLVLADDPGAVRAVEALAVQASPHTARGRQALYWSIRLWSDRHPLRAAQRAVALVSADPFDWYAVLLRRRYPGVFAPVARPDVAPAPGAIPPSFASQVAQVEALAQAGLPWFARQQLAQLAPALEGVGAHALLTSLATRHGAPNLAMRTALRAYGASVRTPPTEADPPELHQARRAAWPTGYDAEVQAAAQQFDVEPALVRAFIRKESAYRPEVVSRAHAIGLMQIIERTALAIRRRSRRADLGTNLFDPATNIRHGAWYVSALRRRFAGQLPLVAAGYNAGPGAIDTWTRAPQEATDRFVERIPYKEARLYVKRLAASYLRYRVLHDGVSLDEAVNEIPLTLDLTARPGVDF